MIDRPTVLVLGAGASIPYGLPSGKTLVESIAKSLSRIPFPKDVLAATGLVDYLEFNGIKPDDYSEFIPRLLDSKASIDDFVKYNPSFEDVAKISIFYIIRLYEHKYFNEHKNYLVDDWMEYLLRLLDYSVENVEQLKNLKIITYNYDRLLEHKLNNYFAAVNHNYYQEKKDYSAHFDIRNSIEICHVYGDVGDISNINELMGMPYSVDDRENAIWSTRPTLIDYFRRINLIHSKNHFSTVERVQELIQKAEKVVVLGLSLGRENLKILNLDKYNSTELSPGGNKVIHKFIDFTTHDLTNSEVKRSLYAVNIKYESDNCFPVKCLDYFRNNF